MRDSSAQRHTLPATNDTVVHPLYGLMMPDSGESDPSQSERLRKAIDPIYPPVLMEVLRGGPPVLLRETIGNRRDGHIGMDGGGVGMFVVTVD